LNNGDFETTLSRARRGDFVYLDPPFSVKARRVFKEYGANIFGQHQLTRLRAWLERLADSRIRFLVSYAESSEAEVLSKGFHSRLVPIRRHIAGFSASRAPSTEMLIYN
jgi:DNA adenine methylase